MKYILIIILLIITSSCASKKSNDKVLIIDIYQNDMTYKKYKQYVINYAENATFPSLSEQ